MKNNNNRFPSSGGRLLCQGRGSNVEGDCDQCRFLPRDLCASDVMKYLYSCKRKRKKTNADTRRKNDLYVSAEANRRKNAI